VEIAGVLRRSIENDTYKKGARLPTERELCEEFGVSRAVIREATTILKTDGVIESFQGKVLISTEK
jgi:DNA-binding FadR family transcriptional regulator